MTNTVDGHVADVEAWLLAQRATITVSPSDSHPGGIVLKCSVRSEGGESHGVRHICVPDAGDDSTFEPWKMMDDLAPMLRRHLCRVIVSRRNSPVVRAAG